METGCNNQHLTDFPRRETRKGGRESRDLDWESGDFAVKTVGDTDEILFADRNK